MQINKISQAMQSELRKIDGSARKQDKEQPVAKAGVTDRSELSADGQKQRAAKGETQIISSMVKAQPDERAEKIAEAKVKINSGHYNTGEFIDRLAGKLANAMA
ncbi:MAG: flagellar biosynthesis anti-sigma factor FlgM [Chitinispirillia bacterium]|nr:flagellar biosynthesis anti-sigma factor FlgM [Chitinispirillia bacterium]MCL2241470.1 flagellar biosynthesis anti-sigma factor FlgM [Chitinispirillia bacterium]